MSLELLINKHAVHKLGVFRGKTASKEGDRERQQSSCCL